MFQIPSYQLQFLLQFQTSQFMMCLGAGDFNYQSRELTTGLYRERKSVSEKLELKSSPKKLCEKKAYSPSPEAIHISESRNAEADFSPKQRKRTVEEIFNSYRLADISGPQWTNWRDPRSRAQPYDRLIRLPPSPPEPHAEIYMDIHEERMEGLAFSFEEAPMSLTT